MKRKIISILREIESDIERLSLKNLENSVTKYSAEHLNDKKYHEKTLMDPESGIPLIKSVCGSALNVLTQSHKPSEEVLWKAERIISFVHNNGFDVYKERDLRIVYIYFRSYRIYHQENK